MGKYEVLPGQSAGLSIGPLLLLSRVDDCPPGAGLGFFGAATILFLSF